MNDLYYIYFHFHTRSDMTLSRAKMSADSCYSSSIVFFFLQIVLSSIDRTRLS